MGHAVPVAEPSAPLIPLPRKAVIIRERPEDIPRQLFLGIDLHAPAGDLAAVPVFRGIHLGGVPGHAEPGQMLRQLIVALNGDENAMAQVLLIAQDGLPRNRQLGGPPIRAPVDRFECLRLGMDPEPQLEPPVGGQVPPARGPGAKAVFIGKLIVELPVTQVGIEPIRGVQELRVHRALVVGPAAMADGTAGRGDGGIQGGQIHGPGAIILRAVGGKILVQRSDPDRIPASEDKSLIQAGAPFALPVGFDPEQRILDPDRPGRTGPAPIRPVEMDIHRFHAIIEMDRRLGPGPAPGAGPGQAADQVIAIELGPAFLDPRRAIGGVHQGIMIGRADEVEFQPGCSQRLIQLDMPVHVIRSPEMLHDPHSGKQGQGAVPEGGRIGAGLIGQADRAFDHAGRAGHVQGGHGSMPHGIAVAEIHFGDARKLVRITGGKGPVMEGEAVHEEQVQVPDAAAAQVRSRIVVHLEGRYAVEQKGILPGAAAPYDQIVYGVVDGQYPGQGLDQTGEIPEAGCGAIDVLLGHAIRSHVFVRPRPQPLLSLGHDGGALELQRYRIRGVPAREREIQLLRASRTQAAIGPGLGTVPRQARLHHVAADRQAIGEEAAQGIGPDHPESGRIRPGFRCGSRAGVGAPIQDYPDPRQSPAIDAIAHRAVKNAQDSARRGVGGEKKREQNY